MTGLCFESPNDTIHVNVVCNFTEMRDTNENMIELIDVSKEKEIYSSLIKHQINGEFYKLRFGILTSDYGRLKRILEFRPFENTEVSPYRYFFAQSLRKDSSNENIVHIDIRVEQLDKHKQYEFQISKKFMSNILWFSEIKDKKEIEHLIERE